jgi:prepilin-type N-terminal cleavage/methylation domain-containing protein
MKMRSQRGMTLIEILIVVSIMVLVIIAVAPLIRSTWVSWITADRRDEIIETGRVGLGKTVREIRMAYDIFDATDTAYIDYYPQWATGANALIYRFNYNAPSVDYEFGLATPAFTPDSLAAPVDSFSYVTYTRSMDEGAGRGRRINSIKFNLAVSDERQLLPTTDHLNPINFLSQAHLRRSREGWQISDNISFASEVYQFDISNGDPVCFKAYCDRVDPTAMVNKDVTITFGFGNTRVLQMDYFATDDYFATCCVANQAPCNLGSDPTTDIDILLSDGTEWTWIRDQIRVSN